jgi:phage gp36-like protein
MSYCAKADILEQLDEDILIQLTDDEDTGSVDDDMVTRAIADADAEIDSYCGVRYPVPFSTVPGIIRKLSVEFSIYNLYARRKGVSDDRKDRYNNGIRFLRDVSKGVVSLGADDPDSTPSDANTPQISSSDRIFSRDKMKGF